MNLRLLSLALFALSVAVGQSALGQGANVFLPMLKRAMTAELYFVKKVCKPTDEQFEQIHRTGLEAVTKVSQQYAENQRRRKKPQTWQDPNEAIAEALRPTIERVMSAEVAKTYADEISARFVANREANAGVIVNLIDEQTLLDPVQQRGLLEAIRDQWDPQWSSGSVVFLYPQYAALPDTNYLRPYLSDLQQRLWAYQQKGRRISLSWQVHFGTNEFLGLVALEELEPPASDASPREEQP